MEKCTGTNGSYLTFASENGKTEDTLSSHAISFSSRPGMDQQIYVSLFYGPFSWRHRDLNALKSGVRLHARCHISRKSIQVSPNKLVFIINDLF